MCGFENNSRNAASLAREYLPAADTSAGDQISFRDVPVESAYKEQWLVH